MKKMWSKKWFRVLTILFFILIILFLVRGPILRGVGSWLDAGDPIRKTDVCFVLGGNSYERGMMATQIYDQYHDQKFVATGGNFPTQILCLDTLMTEAALTRHWMIANEVPNEQIDTLISSHSTMEESEEIMAYCERTGAKDIAVISSGFHIRRVRWVFEDKFKNAGINITFIGAPSMEYTQDNWWKTEEGLIMTNNEIVKLAYYFIKY